MPVSNIENIKKPIADLYPVVSGLRCVELKIPDDDGYLWVLAGFVSILGDSWSWSGSLDDRLARARLWIRAYEATDWMQCMNCEQLIECITPLINAQTDQIRQILNNTTYGTDFPPGLPLPEEEITRNLAGDSNPTCDLDVVWAQALQLVQYANSLIVDALEKAEEATNDIELAQIIGQLPGLDELGVDAIFGYLNMLQEGIAEGYVSAYTEEYEEQAACSIFCLSNLDCAISLDDVYSVFYFRVTAYFGNPLTAITTINDLMSYLMDQDLDSDIIADTLMMVVFGGGVLANLFLGDVGTKALETILRLAVDDASSDWETLCTDCPDEWSHESPAADSFGAPYDLLTFAGATTTTDGTKIIGADDTGADAVFLNFEVPLTGDVRRIAFHVEYNPASGANAFVLADEGGMLQSWDLGAASPQVFVWTGVRTGSHTYTVLSGVGGNIAAGSFLRITQIDWSGEGVDPF